MASAVSPPTAAPLFPLLTARLATASKGLLELRMDKDGQRGLFLTRHAPRGTVVLQEMSVGSIHRPEQLAADIERKAPGVWAEVWSPAMEKAFSAHPLGPFPPALLSLHKVGMFTFGATQYVWTTSGVLAGTCDVSAFFPCTSMLNNHCVAVDPSTSRVHRPSAMREMATCKHGMAEKVAIVLARDMKQGEEVTIRYGGPWFAKKGIVCTCAACTLGLVSLDGDDWTRLYPDATCPFAIQEELSRKSGLWKWLLYAQRRLPGRVMVRILAIKNDIRVLLQSIIV